MMRRVPLVLTAKSRYQSAVSERDVRRLFPDMLSFSDCSQLSSYAARCVQHVQVDT